MQRYLFIALIMLWLTTPSHAALTQWRAASLNGVRETTVHSARTSRDYRIQIAAIGAQPAQGYPVLLLLDGDLMLPLAALMMQSLAFQPHYQQGILLVGIGYPGQALYNLDARAKDYTPPPEDEKSGGAAAFQRFIVQELFATIGEQYPINREKTALMGHSYGGLFALYCLFNHPHTVESYLIASPSIWWANQRILDDETKLQHAPALIRFSVGQYEQAADPRAPENPQRAAKKRARAMVDNLTALAQRLEQRFPKAIISTTIYAGENHGSVIPRSIQDGIIALYDAWYPRSH